MKNVFHFTDEEMDEMEKQIGSEPAPINVGDDDGNQT